MIINKFFHTFSLVVILGLVGCGGGDSSSSNSNTKTIAVIPKGLTHEFWKSIHAGAVKASMELNEGKEEPVVEILWEGALKEDDREAQINIVDTMILRGVNGIVLAPMDDQALVKPILNAKSVDIPVVIIDSGVQSEDYVSFVATDNFEGGRLGGEHLAKLIGGKGNVILVRYQEGSASTTKRENGFLEAMKNYPDIKVLSDNQYSGATRETALKLAENLGRTYGEQLNGVFCPCEPVTVTMVKALKDLNLAGGKVKIVGFDASEASVNDLKAGDVQALVLQDPVNMGYLGVKTIMSVLAGETVEKRIDTGVAIVTPDNMSESRSQELLFPPLKKYLGE